ncbi:hypothetical protein [Pleomorphovibrio marinus]|uniref:hypothetical protein n=1 Tax=Pleomorphovibrio marinus TaxID=2164132 RepID=UPI0013008E62|nr:hypothetical protein [Pleomorphovibrio marinus]
MSKVLCVVMLFGSLSLSFAKEKQDKTFLILFNQQELTQEFHGAAHLEMSFLGSFQTRAFGGNSDAAILVTVQDKNWTVSDMGASLVVLDNGKVLELEKIAYRIVDLSACSDSYRALINAGASETPKLAKKKSENTQTITLTF